MLDSRTARPKSPDGSCGIPKPYRQVKGLRSTATAGSREVQDQANKHKYRWQVIITRLAEIHCSPAGFAFSR